MPTGSGAEKPGVIATEWCDELLLGPEGQSSHRRIRPVGADDEVRFDRRPVGQRGNDAVAVVSQL
ncbi:MAG: hypothetical protein JWR13_5162 [Mycobacterium sp.]|jgi:hypothetical protein|nr:hypothetical protein [Mycobacterium sp.]